jgi:hypothetical protein
MRDLAEEKTRTGRCARNIQDRTHHSGGKSMSPAAAASAGRKWGRDGKWGIVQIIVSQLGGFVKIIGSRLLTAIQFRGICANNRIAIINRDPNEGVICKICG